MKIFVTLPLKSSFMQNGEKKKGKGENTSFGWGGLMGGRGIGNLGNAQRNAFFSSSNRPLVIQLSIPDKLINSNHDIEG